MKHLFGHLSLGPHKGVYSITTPCGSDSQRSHSQSSDSASMTLDTPDDDGACTSSQTTKMPEDGGMSSGLPQEPVDGFTLNSDQGDGQRNIQTNIIAEAVANSNAPESSGENLTLGKIGLFILSSVGGCAVTDNIVNEHAGDYANTTTTVITTTIGAVGGMDVINQNMSTFVEQSAQLIKVLDEVAKLHPFIGGMSDQIFFQSSLKRDPRISGCHGL